MKKAHRVVVWFAAALSIFLGVCLLFPAPSTQANTSTGVSRWVEFQLSPLGQNGTDVSENFVVWSDYAGHPYDPFPLADTCLNEYPPTNPFLPPDGRAAICLYDLATGVVMSLTNATVYDYLPRTDGTWVVFRRHYSPADLVAVNLLTGEELVVLDSNDLGLFVMEYSHQVDHGFVVATGLWPLSTNRAVMVYNIARGESTIITQSSTTQPGHADIAYPYVVWHEIGPTGGMDVMGYDLTTQTTFTISVQMSHEGYARIEGTTVVWEREGDIVGYDIAAANPFTVTQDEYQQWEPAISERWIVWQDDRHGQWEIYAYDRSNGQTYRVTNHPLNDQHPVVAGDIIAWERSSDVAEGVYAARLMHEFSFLPLIFRP